MQNQYRGAGDRTYFSHQCVVGSDDPRRVRCAAVGCCPGAATVHLGIVTSRSARLTIASAIFAQRQDPDVAQTHWLPLFGPCTEEYVRGIFHELRAGWEDRLGLSPMIDDSADHLFRCALMLRPLQNRACILFNVLGAGHLATVSATREQAARAGREDRARTTASRGRPADQSRRTGSFPGRARDTGRPGPSDARDDGRCGQTARAPLGRRCRASKDMTWRWSERSER